MYILNIYWDLGDPWCRARRRTPPTAARGSSWSPTAESSVNETGSLCWFVPMKSPGLLKFAQLHSTATQVATSMMWGEWEGPSPWSYSGSSRVEGSLESCPIILPVGTQMRRICTREPRTMSWWSDSDIIGSPSFLHCNSTSLRLTHVPFECANRGRTLRGIMANHSGLCLTVFSASNYCGSVGAMVATGCRCNWNAGIWCTLPFFLLNLRQSRRCSRAATVNEKAPFQQWLWSDYW